VPPDAGDGRAQRPDGWHEIKHDGYRLMVQRTPQGVRIKTRRGYDCPPIGRVFIRARMSGLGGKRKTSALSEY